MCLAVPGKVIEITGATDLQKMAIVDFFGVTRKVSIAFVPDVQIGEYVIVHAGVAINKVNELEAIKTLAEIDKI